MGTPKDRLFEMLAAAGLLIEKEAFDALYDEAHRASDTLSSSADSNASPE